MLEIANVWAIVLIKQNDDHNDREISNDQCEDLEESTLSSNIEEDNLDIGQEVLNLDLARSDKII